MCVKDENGKKKRTRSARPFFCVCFLFYLFVLFVVLGAFVFCLPEEDVETDGHEDDNDANDEGGSGGLHVKLGGLLEFDGLGELAEEAKNEEHEKR